MGRLETGYAIAPIKTESGNSLGEFVKQEGEEPLSPMARLFHKPDSNIYILAILASKRLIDPQHVQANMGDMVRAHPRFSCLQVMDEENGGSGGMKWVRTEVNYEDHVVVPKIDLTTMDSHIKYLEDYMFNLSKTTIDMSKPLWDVHILNGLKTSEASKSIAIIRIHHSMGDGMSLMSVLLAFSRKAADENSMPDLPGSVKKSPTFTYMGKLTSFCRVAWNTLVDVLVFLATVLYLTDVKTPLKASSDVGYKPKRMVFETFQLEDVKLVSRATHTTVNDVLMGMMESALSRYLNRKQVIGSEEEATSKDSDRPKSIKLRAAVFFNIRFLSGVHPIKEMMKQGSLTKWGNKIGYSLYPFNAMIRNNPLEYVYQAKTVMDRKKASLESKFTYAFGKMLLRFIGVKAIGFPSSPTFYFSSLMGPKEEISLFGYPIDYIASTCYGAPTALLIHVMTYANKLTFAMAVDEETIPNPEWLLDDLAESLNLFKQAVLAPRNNHLSTEKM